MPDLTREEVERRLKQLKSRQKYAEKHGLAVVSWGEGQALQTALSLYDRAEAAEQERDALRAEAVGLREALKLAEPAVNMADCDETCLWLRARRVMGYE